MEPGYKWTIVIAGIVAVIGQFWGAHLYLPLIGGAVVVVAALMSK